MTKESKIELLLKSFENYRKISLNIQMLHRAEESCRFRRKNAREIENDC
ncbi:TPA: hypothetical protein U1C31_001136 [Streptococcus suis]|nr:hypothetical protein [Streptococcus suis]